MSAARTPGTDRGFYLALALLGTVVAAGLLMHALARMMQKRAPLAAGEELLYDYCLWDGEPDDKAPCYCGSANCRGTMYSEEEIERQRKLVEKQKKKKARDRASAKKKPVRTKR